jgi:hypothetical protein
MKTRVPLFVTILALTALLSSCYSVGYRGGYDRSYYGSRYYAPRPYVRVVPPPVVVRPRVYVNPPRYNYRPRYESRGRNNYRHGRRRW